MSTNNFTSLADDADLNHTTFNTIASAFDSQLTDMDDGTHNFSAINVDGGAIDGTAIGGASAAPATFTNLMATGNLWGPAFSVTMGGGTQDVSTVSNAIIEFDTEVLDSNSDFNTGTYTFTPTVEGFYYCCLHVTWTAAFNANKQMGALIQASGFNNVGYKETQGSNAMSVVASGITYCNGSSDVIIAYAYNGDSTTRTISGNTYATYFFGWRIQ